MFDNDDNNDYYRANGESFRSCLGGMSVVRRGFDGRWMLWIGWVDIAVVYLFFIVLLIRGFSG